MSNRPRYHPHQPELLRRLHHFYTAANGAECGSQQLCLRQMAEACRYLAWMHRVEKGILDLAESGTACEIHWQQLEELTKDRARWLGLFDKAFNRFCDIRASRNQAELHLALTGQERYPIPARTLFSDPSFAMVPVGNRDGTL